MNKKSLIAYLIAAGVFLCVIALAVVGLYSGSGHKTTSISKDAFAILEAVPSDAAMIATFSAGEDMFEILSDSTNVLINLLTNPEDKNIRSFIGALFSSKIGRSLLKSPSAVSLHFSAGLVPLIIMTTGSSANDSTASVKAILREAESAGLSSCFLAPGTAVQQSGLFKEGVILVSRSETILNSSVRHISNGTSVLESEGLASLASQSGSDDAIYVCNRYVDKIISKNFARRYRAYADFFASAGKWTVFRNDILNSGKAKFSGNVSYSSDVRHYLNVLEASASESRVAQMLPASVDFVLSIPVNDIRVWCTAFEKFIDASGGSAPGRKEKDWAISSKVKEVALAYFHVGRTLEPVILVRSSARSDSVGRVVSNSRVGYVSSLFGKVFSVQDETSSITLGDWTITGSRAAVGEYADEKFLSNSLKDMILDCGISANIPSKCGALAYYNMTADPTIVDNVFSKDLAEGLRNMSRGVSNVPILFSVEKAEDGMLLNLLVSRLNLAKSKAPVVERDTVVVVPKGPFQVVNAVAGTTNLLEQQPNMYIVLKETSGKGIWGIPFKTPLCGRVQSIDYYNNGKSQFLFASGSKLYLLDRLGRFVSGFPSELGKEVLLGPDVYDFTGAKGYRVMILHKDNSLEMYNLHGQKPAGWKGIKASQTIKNLPELIKVGTRSFWVVRTSIQTFIFPFDGGEVLTKNEGQKMIRPDSEVVVGENSVEVTCYDGKKRTIKL